MPFTVDGADACFDDGLFGADRRIHLHTADVPTASNIVTGGGYLHANVRQNQTEMVTSGDNRRVRNSAALAFGAPSGNWSQQRSIGLWDGDPAASGKLLWYESVGQTHAVRGQTVSIPENQLNIDIPPMDGITNAGIDQLLRLGGLMGTLHVALHTADPPTGTNEITGTGYATVSIPSTGWQLTTPSTGVRRLSNSGIVRFPTPGGAWSRARAVGVWTAASASGSLLHHQAVSDFTAARDGALNLLRGGLTLNFEVA